MNPYPLSPLNHLTVPVAISKSPPCQRNERAREAQRKRHHYSLERTASVASPAARAWHLSSSPRIVGRDGGAIVWPREAASAWRSPPGGVPGVARDRHAADRRRRRRQAE